MSDLSTIPGTRMKIDWPKLVSGKDIIVTTPPHDTLNGVRLGNGDIGVSVFGPPECMTLTVGKNDILDYRTDPQGDWNVPTPSAKPAGAIRFRIVKNLGALGQRPWIGRLAGVKPVLRLFDWLFGVSAMPCAYKPSG